MFAACRLREVCLPMRSGDVTHHFQSWGLLLFTVMVLFAKDRISTPDFIFLFFLVILGRHALVLELVGLIFRQQKKESKQGLRWYAGVREYCEEGSL